MATISESDLLSLSLKDLIIKPKKRMKRMYKQYDPEVIDSLKWNRYAKENHKKILRIYGNPQPHLQNNKWDKAL